MRNKRYLKIIAYVLGAAILAQVFYSLALGTDHSLFDWSRNSDYEKVEVKLVNLEAVDSEALAKIVVSQAVLEQIKAADTADYETNVVHYKELLVTLNVHEAFKSEMERLLLDGAALPDILTAYEFLYYEFGNIQDLNDLLAERKAGKAWNEIFEAYSRGRSPFIPQAFDTDYLEGLREAGLSSDDIMIADRIAHETGTEVSKVIAEKSESEGGWKDFNMVRNILFSAEELPRVQMTTEELDKYVKQTGWTDDLVAEAFVLAQRVSRTPEDIIARMEAGLSDEQIYEESYAAKYGAAI